MINRKITVIGIVGLMFLGILPQHALLSTSGQEPQSILGLSMPRIDGFLDDFSSDLNIGEWEDAFHELINFQLMKTQSHLVLNQEDEEEAVQLSIKYVDNNLFIALQFPKELDELSLQFDIDNDGKLSNGDVRIIAKLPEDTSEFGIPQIINRMIVLEIYKLGVWINPLETLSVLIKNRFEEFVKLLTSAVTIAIRGWDQFDKSENPKTSIEIRFNPSGLEGILNFIFPGLSLSAFKGTIGYAMTVKTSTGLNYGYPSAPITTQQKVFVAQYTTRSFTTQTSFLLPPIDMGVDHIEIVQAVQTANNYLTLVRDKYSIVRIFIDNPTDSLVKVDIKLHGYDYSSYTLVELGMLSSQAWVPISFDRADMDTSLNFILPDDWISNTLLFLEAEVTPVDFRDTNSADNKLGKAFYFEKTHDLNIYYIRVNEGTEASPSQLSQTTTNLITSALADSYPVANPNFIELGWEAIGAQGDNWDADQLNTDLAGVSTTIAFAILLQILTGQEEILPLPDQIFGFVKGGGGLSTPSWYENGQSLAAWGSITATSHVLVMAHEINHNLGSNEWGRHVGNPDEDTWGGSNPDRDTNWGCGAGGPDSAWPGTNDNLNQLYTDTLGWRSGVGIIDATKDDIMSYCKAGNPRKWISDYRWEELVDRLKNFVSGEPGYPSSLFFKNEVSEAIRQQSTGIGLDLDSSSTRMISGYIHKDGYGQLNPSYTMPGTFTNLPKAIKGMAETHYLLVEYSNQSSIKYPLYPQYSLFGGDDHPQTNKSPFFYWLPDDGMITRISIIDVKGNVLLNKEKEKTQRYSTGWKTEGKLTVPTEILRSKNTMLKWELDLRTNISTVYSQVQYSHDGRHWYNLGSLTVDNQLTFSINELPGGEAKFRLIVTNGFDSHIIESTEKVNVSLLPASVQIKWNKHRAGDKSSLSLDQTTSTTHTLGSLLSLAANAYDPQTGIVTPDELVWEVEKVDQKTGITLEQMDSDIIGSFFNYQFTLKGTYRVTVSLKSSGIIFDSIIIEVIGGAYTAREAYNKFLAGGGTTSGTDDKESTGEPMPISLSIWLITLFFVGVMAKAQKRKR